MDKNEFSKRVLEAEPTLYHISKSILKNDFDCADAVQEAVLKALKNLDGLREERYFKTWLCRILIRECYRVCNARKFAVPYEEYAENGIAPECEREEIGLYKAMMELKKQRRIAVVLHYVEGFKTSEIAKILKIPEGTVKSRLHKARAELKRLLNETEDNDDENESYFSERAREFS